MLPSTRIGAVIAMVEKLKMMLRRVFIPRAAERDPGFRNEIERLSRRGMMVAGGLGFLSAGIYVGWYLLDDKPITWIYVDPTHRSLLEELLIVALSIGCVTLARTRTAPARGRLIIAIMLLVISAAMMIEDVGRGDPSFAAGYLSLALILAVGTMPYRPMQSMALGLAVIVLYVLCIYFLPPLMDVTVAGLSDTQLVFLFVLTFMISAISAVIYRSRYEQYHALRDLRLTQAQLIHSEKMASLGQLTAGIAHEIKNPLNFINNFAELNVRLTDDLAKMLRSQFELASAEDVDRLENIVTYLHVNNEKIEEQGKRADAIIRSMMLHARGTSGDRRAVEVNALVEEYVNLAYKGAHARPPDLTISVERDYADDAGEVAVAPQELGRVLINLLTNAFDAVLEKRSTNGRYVPVVRVGTRRVADSVEIRIKDNGTGIPSSVLPKIFDPFFTTKPVGKGTGLGLSISYDVVVHGHGGRLHVENDEGRGATFVVTLPTISTTAAVTGR